MPRAFHHNVPAARPVEPFSQKVHFFSGAKTFEPESAFQYYSRPHLFPTSVTRPKSDSVSRRSQPTFCRRSILLSLAPRKNKSLDEKISSWGEYDYRIRNAHAGMPSVTLIICSLLFRCVYCYYNVRAFDERLSNDFRLQ